MLTRMYFQQTYLLNRRYVVNTRLSYFVLYCIVPEFSYSGRFF